MPELLCESCEVEKLVDFRRNVGWMFAEQTPAIICNWERVRSPVLWRAVVDLAISDIEIFCAPTPSGVAVPGLWESLAGASELARALERALARGVCVRLLARGSVPEGLPSGLAVAQADAPRAAADFNFLVAEGRAFWFDQQVSRGLPQADALVSCNHRELGRQLVGFCADAWSVGV